MATCDSTENDHLIAILLSEDPQYSENEFLLHAAPIFESSPPPRVLSFDSSPISFVQKSENHSQISDDGDLAFILQIEETVLFDNRITSQTANIDEKQFVKTHAEMTKALQPKESTGYMTRIVGMFLTIQTRYNECQGKNQELINQLQRFAVELGPAIFALKRPGKSLLPKISAGAFAIGLATNLLRGNLSLNDAKDIVNNLTQLWQESSIWYEFFEQLAYILLAVTLPSLAQGAMGKIRAKITNGQ